MTEDEYRQLVELQAKAYTAVETLVSESREIHEAVGERPEGEFGAWESSNWKDGYFLYFEGDHVLIHWDTYEFGEHYNNEYEVPIAEFLEETRNAALNVRVADLVERRRAIDAQWEAHDDANERAEYERLRAKFEGEG